jgi:hypothetical protein
MWEKMKIPKSERLVALLTTSLLFITALASPYVAASTRVRVVDLPPPSTTSISCSVAPTSVVLGSSITVSGSISPAVSNVTGVTVTLTFTKPDSTTLDRTTTTGTDASFSDTYTPDSAGSWSVKASWAGNDYYLGSTSFETPFTVNASGGIPMEYVYIVVVIVIIAIAAIGFYWYRKRK